MSKTKIIEILRKLVESTDFAEDMKELCISSYQSGEMVVGMRRILISEIDSSDD